MFSFSFNFFVCFSIHHFKLSLYFLLSKCLIYKEYLGISSKHPNIKAYHCDITLIIIFYNFFWGAGVFFVVFDIINEMKVLNSSVIAVQWLARSPHLTSQKEGSSFKSSDTWEYGFLPQSKSIHVNVIGDSKFAMQCS